MTPLQPWSVTATNLPEHADNAIHTDTGARAAGFPGALVAGVTTYGYLTHAPATAWGGTWLAGGGAEVRFRHPVLDGDRVDLEIGDAGNVTADVSGATKVEATFVERAAEMLRCEGEELELIEFTIDQSWSDYGSRSGDDCPIYAELGVAHPTIWPRIANRFCHEQLVDGSWIHVRSKISHHGLASIGTTIQARAVVADRFESRAGERVVLDVRIDTDGVPLATVEHEAIIRLAL